MRPKSIDALRSPLWRHFSLAALALLTVFSMLPWASSCGDADLLISGNPPVRTRTAILGTRTPDPNDPAE